MRLGGPVYEKYDDPRGWVAAMKRAGYTAAYCPVGADQPAQTIQAYAEAARQAGIVIAEVGAWSNPISTDETQRRQAMEHCARQLALADQIGAVCCVNIAGSRGSKWDGPDPSHFTPEVFDLIVQSVRMIIDTAKPSHAFYTLEPMPWVPPDSPDNYLELIRAIDRRQFAVHLDPVNMINCPRRCLDSGAFLRECFQKLGPHIKSVHAKDIVLAQDLTTHLSEARPGLGTLDYVTFLTEVNKLDRDVPLMLEHLQTAEDYQHAAAYVRATAQKAGVPIY